MKSYDEIYAKLNILYESGIISEDEFEQIDESAYDTYFSESAFKKYADMKLDDNKKLTNYIDEYKDIKKNFDSKSGSDIYKPVKKYINKQIRDIKKDQLKNYIKNISTLNATPEYIKDQSSGIKPKKSKIKSGNVDTHDLSNFKMKDRKRIEQLKKEKEYFMKKTGNVGQSPDEYLRANRYLDLYNQKKKIEERK